MSLGTQNAMNGGGAPQNGGDSQTQGLPTASASSTSFGNPIYDQIGGYIKQYTGQAPTLQQVSQWGTNVDSNYLNTIRGAIQNSKAAQDYNASQQQQQAQGPSQAPPQASGSPTSATGQLTPPQAGPTPVPQPSAMPTPATTGATPNQLRYTQPVDLSNINYQPYQFSQFGGAGSPEAALMQAVLTNPTTMSPSVVAQMKGQQQQQALLQQQQNQQQIDQSAAARNVVGSGQTAGLTAQNAWQTQQNLLNQFANTDIQAAKINRQNQLDALGAAGNFYTTGLAGQQAQAGQSQQAFQDAMGKAMNQFQVNEGVAGNAQQNYNQDIAASQIPFAQQMQIAQMLENARQFNAGLGLNYNQLDQTGQMSLLNWLTGGSGA